MVISCIGDSLTEGDYGIVGKSGIANVHPENYPYFLSRLIGCEVRNFGKCGYRSSTIEKYWLDGNIDVTGSDKVLIMLGSNGGQDPESDTPDNASYISIINMVKRDAPKAEIILLTPPNATVNPKYSNCGYLPQVINAQRFTRKTARELGLKLIDIGADSTFSPETEYMYQPNDGLHFAFEGYMKLAEIIYDAIK